MQRQINRADKIDLISFLCGICAWISVVLRIIIEQFLLLFKYDYDAPFHYIIGFLFGLIAIVTGIWIIYTKQRLERTWISYMGFALGLLYYIIFGILIIFFIIAGPIGYP